MAGSSDKHLDLKWIEEQPLPLKPIDEFEMVGQRSFSSTILKKTKENIFVPLGLLATTACLTMGLLNMRRGNSRNQQIFMRGRVFFQAFTFAAMTIGVLLTAKKRNPKKIGDQVTK